MFHYLVQYVLFAHFLHAWCDMHTSYDFSGSTCFSLFQGNVQTLKGQEIFILFLISLKCCLAFGATISSAYWLVFKKNIFGLCSRNRTRRLLLQLIRLQDIKQELVHLRLNFDTCDCTGSKNPQTNNDSTKKRCILHIWNKILVHL